jgi:hypothetical protein
MDGLKKSDSIDGAAAFPPLPLRADGPRPLRADGPRECAPDDRLREAIHRAA